MVLQDLSVKLEQALRRLNTSTVVDEQVRASAHPHPRPRQSSPRPASATTTTTHR